MSFSEDRVCTQRLAGQDALVYRFPEVDADLKQDEEWLEVRVDGEWQRLRLHDYASIYAIPGLYEAVFYRTLKCCSPKRSVALFEEVLAQHKVEPQTLRVLDVGAGNGMVGEQLWTLGAQRLVGIDIVDEARAAALRDRSHVYADYLIEDLTDLSEATERTLRRQRLNCMTCVAALGFSDIPPRAFLKAFDVIETPAWLAFNIKQDFLRENDRSGFAELVAALRSDKILRVEAYRRYRHRLSIRGKPLHYVAMVARKLRDLPDEWSMT